MVQVRNIRLIQAGRFDVEFDRLLDHLEDVFTFLYR